MSKGNTAATSNVVTDPRKVAAEVRDLLNDLRAAAEAKDVKAGKRIRRALRARGHRGGLKSAPPAPVKGKRKSRNAA